MIGQFQRKAGSLVRKALRVRVEAPLSETNKHLKLLKTIRRATRARRRGTRHEIRRKSNLCITDRRQVFCNQNAKSSVVLRRTLTTHRPGDSLSNMASMANVASMVPSATMAASTPSSQAQQGVGHFQVVHIIMFERFTDLLVAPLHSQDCNAWVTPECFSGCGSMRSICRHLSRISDRSSDALSTKQAERSLFSHELGNVRFRNGACRNDGATAGVGY